MKRLFIVGLGCLLTNEKASRTVSKAHGVAPLVGISAIASILQTIEDVSICFLSIELDP